MIFFKIKIKIILNHEYNMKGLNNIQIYILIIFEVGLTITTHHVVPH